MSCIDTQALYSGKSAGKDFQIHLRSCLQHLNFTSGLADPDVQMQLVEKSDGTPYYEFVQLYVNGTLVVSGKAESIL